MRILTSAQAVEAVKRVYRVKTYEEAQKTLEAIRRNPAANPQVPSLSLAEIETVWNTIVA